MAPGYAGSAVCVRGCNLDLGLIVSLRKAKREEISPRLCYGASMNQCMIARLLSSATLLIVVIALSIGAWPIVLVLMIAFGIWFSQLGRT